MFCSVTGSKNHIKLICSVPKHLLPTLEASLYANIKYLDIRQVTNPKFTGAKYIKEPNGGSERLYDRDYKVDGNYLDPFVDLLSIFNQVELNQLSLLYCFDFNAKPSLLKKIGGLMISVLFGSSSSAQAQPNQHLMVKASIGYFVEHRDKSLQEIVQSSYSRFAKSKIERSPNPHPITLEIAQIINLFHMPSEITIQGLEYLPYRKLAPANNLPSLDSEINKNDLTIIGKTEYR